MHSSVSDGLKNLLPSTYAGQAALYMHWPFCIKKCLYCDFNSHVRDHIDQEIWAGSYEKEIYSFYQLFPNLRPKSIFFGGGTPSLMQPSTVDHILKTIDKTWGLQSNIEITLEANPSSVEANRFQGYKAAGVNRLSMGIQSLHDNALKFLGRLHNAEDALKALRTARQIFDRVSIDLIYARPDYKENLWHDELSRALEFDLSHLSLYQLTIEEGTAFYHQYHRGQFTLPSEDEAADLYDLTQALTVQAGLPAYEISNHAVQGQESQHNLAYWQGDPYLGIGPGAQGRAPLYDPRDQQNLTQGLSNIQYAQAHMQVKRPEDWIKTVNTVGLGLQSAEVINLQERIIESIMMGLRLTSGINRAYFKKLYGQDVTEFVDLTTMNDDFIVLDKDSLRLTPIGIPVLNHILDKILIISF